MSKKRNSTVSKLILENNLPLIRFLTKRLHNKEDAADIAQEAYARMFMVNDLEHMADTRGFLYRTASNLAIDHLRRKKYHTSYVLDQLGQVSADDGSKNVSCSEENILEAEQQLQRIQEAIGELSPKCRQVFLLHRTKDMTYDEIADVMSISVSMVEKYIIQALNHCRRRLI